MVFYCNLFNNLKLIWKKEFIAVMVKLNFQQPLSIKSDFGAQETSYHSWNIY